MCRVSELSGLEEIKASTDIPVKLIKLASTALCQPLTTIYNESISTGMVPEIFKISIVTPIFKSGNQTELGNYRPISVISPFSKILEGLIYDQLIFFLEKYNILFHYHIGFRRNH